MSIKNVFVASFLFYFNAYASTSIDARGSSPKNLEVCFSPEEDCDQKLILFIKTAKKSIDIAIYSINETGIIETLIKKQKQKKVKIRIIANYQQKPKSESTSSTTTNTPTSSTPTPTPTPSPIHPIRQLQESGIEVVFRRGKNGGIMHNKFTIVDNKKVETGSFNYTRNGSERNRENQIYLFNPSVVKRYQNEFETMWQDKEPSTALDENISGDDF